jgi:FHA domain/DUF1707 SHOCT-like domain
MGASPAEAPTTPDAEPVGLVRASDAERDEVLTRLRDEFAAGRLSHDTFMIRMDAVLQARHVSDLPPLLADLMHAAPAAAAPPSHTGRLRAALDRWLRTGWTWPAPPVGRIRTAAPRSALRLTSGMAHADADPRTPLRRGARRGVPPEPADPLPLEFPRGAQTFFSIGRDAGCDLAIADMTVSRMHARLERMGEGWLLTDLESTNGTRVNGWLVRGEVRVKAGDLVSFGRAEFWLVTREAT